MKPFATFPLDQPQTFQLPHEHYPCCAGTYRAPTPLAAGHTHYGYVYAGETKVTSAAGSFQLGAGMFFSVPGAGHLEGGRGILISRLNHLGFFHLGGPVESKGRLRYIDGCTDSLLIPPPTFGDPCLNLLCFPPGIHQTAHTHPSFRFGVVATGRGFCHFEGQTVPLEAGNAFFINAETRHCFQTRAEAMSVIAFHPDSDFGPEHDNHPMINRTVVDGTSARYLDDIRTGPELSREETDEMPQMQS